jgi:cytosine/adenosine deaminase-related metal-dependent hydrolase
MTYRKFKADYLFTGHDWAPKDSVLITSAEGIVQSILPPEEAVEEVEYHPGLISPGFVNCHCHLELSHMKGSLPEKTGLVDFLLAVIRQRNSSSQEWLRHCIVAAEQEMFDNGIVAVGDICNTTDTRPQKTAGRLHYHNFIETIGFIGSTAPERLAHSRKALDAFTTSPGSIVPHAPYSVSPDLFRLIASLPNNRLLTIHNQETNAENDFYRTGQGDFCRLYQAMGLDISFWRGTGHRSLESYLPYFHPDQSMILVHNVATTASDLEFAAGLRTLTADHPPARPASLYFCLCPNANLYISGDLPDVGLLQRYGCTIVVGTDSLASNHRLSILEELKTLQRSFPQLSTSTLLQWATDNGAHALGQEALLGNFLPGKKPGVVWIDRLNERNFTAQSRARRLI